MGGSYKQCEECGKRALSIATRCPGCGRPFPLPEEPEDSPVPDLRRFVSPNLPVVLAVVVIALAAIDLFPGGPAPDQLSSQTAADSAAAYSEVAYAGTAAAPLTSHPDTSVIVGGYLVAPTWTHVRQSRSKDAALEAVLTPGDTVYADSLERGWYRVALEGEVMGYAHQSTLITPARPGS